MFLITHKLYKKIKLPRQKILTFNLSHLATLKSKLFKPRETGS